MSAADSAMKALHVGVRARKNSACSLLSVFAWLDIAASPWGFSVHFFGALRMAALREPRKGGALVEFVWSLVLTDIGF